MKAEVRIIQDQQIETQPVEVTGYEAEQLLRKYTPNQKFSTHQNQNIPVANELTFEEMVAQEEAKNREAIDSQFKKDNAPRPITFNGNDGYDSEIRYKSDDSGFGLKITVSTDMKLPNY